jgi:hypothetical protein
MTYIVRQTMIALYLHVCLGCTSPYMTLTLRIQNLSRLQSEINWFLCLTKYHAMKLYPVLNQAARHRDIWRNGGITPHLLNHGSRWRWVVSFTPRPLYLRGKSPRYPLDRRLGGPQSRSGHSGDEENKSLPFPAGNRTLVVQPIAPSLFWLGYPASCPGCKSN